MDRECDWKRILYTLENKLKMPGMIYFVVTVEAFSGKFKLECVENRNKYLMNGYISAFFDKPDVDAKKGKTTHTFTNLTELKEVDSQPVSEESEHSEDDGQYSIEYTGDGSVSPPIPVGRSSAQSSEIPNVKPSPPVLSKKTSKADLSDQKKKKQFSIEEEDVQRSLNKKLKSNEEFDNFFDNISDMVFRYEADKDQSKEKGNPVKEEEDKGERLKLWTNQSIKYGRKGSQDELKTVQSVGVGLAKLKPEKFFRKKIPMSLHGKTEKEVREHTGIKDVIFVNKGGTIACGFTLRSVLALAEYSLYN